MDRHYTLRSLTEDILESVSSNNSPIEKTASTKTLESSDCNSEIAKSLLETASELRKHAEEGVHPSYDDVSEFLNRMRGDS